MTRHSHMYDVLDSRVQATDKKAKKQLAKDVEHWRRELLYVFYYPKTEPYIALFPAKPHDDDKLARYVPLRFQHALACSCSPSLSQTTDNGCCIQ